MPINLWIEQSRVWRWRDPILFKEKPQLNTEV